MAKAFASRAQMEKFRELVAMGKMTQTVFDESLALTNVDTLEERLHPKKEDKSAVSRHEQEGKSYE